MKKVITYGTYDLLHEGHIRLLKRAKQLGDYLIVGVTADDFDKSRGKINVQQSLMERIENVKNTGLADEIIIEEYEGQKIDDIHRYDVDIFTVGSDWKGHFDYLNEYCKVIYLDRTEGISSSEIRSKTHSVKVGLVGDVSFTKKFYVEASFVNGMELKGIFTNNAELKNDFKQKDIKVYGNLNEMIQDVDAIILNSHPKDRYAQIKACLLQGKHVLCETPFSIHRKECEELIVYANLHHLILMDSIKTAYGTAYNRLLLLLKSGKIGKVLSIDATCTSLRDKENFIENETWNSISEWGPTALLPIFQILGVDYKTFQMTSFVDKEHKNFDLFTKIDFIYENAVANLKIGKGIKSEGELIISGTQGYVYVPAPWWKMDYFEIRYENQNDNKRYFYPLDGEGIRFELVAFVKSIVNQKQNEYISKEVSVSISEMIEQFYKDTNKRTIE